MSDIKAASDNFSNNGSGNNVKIASDNSVVRIEKPALFRFGDKIYNQITNGLSKDEATKLFNDLLNPKIQELLDRLEKLEGNMNKLNKPIRDSVNALYASSEEDYEEKTKLLQNILIKKLENLDDNRAHYLTLQGIEAIKNISSDEMKLLALMVFFLSFTPHDIMPGSDKMPPIIMNNDNTTKEEIKEHENYIAEENNRDEKINNTVDQIIVSLGIDEFSNKLSDSLFCKNILSSLHVNGLIIKTTISGRNSYNKPDNHCQWLRAKKFGTLIYNTEEITELGNFLGTQILDNLGLDEMDFSHKMQSNYS